jgi:thiosulfate reductase cytochrome b subunit
MLSAGGYPVMLGTSLRLPPIFPTSAVAFAVLRHLHTWFAMLLFLTFLAHMGAALYHGLIRRDGVLSSMLRGRRKTATATIGYSGEPAAENANPDVGSGGRDAAERIE